QRWCRGDEAIEEVSGPHHSTGGARRWYRQALGLGPRR
ncbi:hypothetical protein BN1723_019416, partial [Verticillium longisporum]